MLAPLSRTARWLAAGCIALAGCAETPYQAAAVNVPPQETIPSSAQRLRTFDPDEIRRRFGDYAFLPGGAFVASGSTWVQMIDYKWHVNGALVRADFLTCYPGTRKCNEDWYWIQYDAAQKRLNHLSGQTGLPFAHSVVQPDGSLAVTQTNGNRYEYRFDFDKDEGVHVFPGTAAPVSDIPTERKQFTEITRQWREVAAATRAAEQQAAAERAAEQRAARNRAEAESAQNFNRALNAFSQSYNSSMADHRRQQAQSAALNDRISRSMDSSTRSSPSRPAPPPIPSAAPQALRAPAPAVSSLSPAAARAPERVASAPPPQKNAARTEEKPRAKLIATAEAILVCSKPSGPNGAFSCRSPVGKLDGSQKEVNPDWRTPEAMVRSWNEGCTEMRRLPSTTHLVWGCGFGATNNTNSLDRSAGVDVRGRRTYYCHPKETGCRKTEP